MRESQIESYLVKQSKVHGWLCFKWVSPSHQGVPDRILISPLGRVVFVEVKAPTGRLSPLQAHCLGQLTGRGCECVVIWSKEDVDAFFERVAG